MTDIHPGDWFTERRKGSGQARRFYVWEVRPEGYVLRHEGRQEIKAVHVEVSREELEAGFVRGEPNWFGRKFRAGKVSAYQIGVVEA